MGGTYIGLSSLVVMVYINGETGVWSVSMIKREVKDGSSVNTDVGG